MPCRQQRRQMNAPARKARRSPELFALALAIAFGGPGLANGDPLVLPGDTSLRHDIQLLSDQGIITGPVTSWPLSWSAILADLNRVGDEDKLADPVILALARVRESARRETQGGEATLTLSASAAEQPLRVRSFADTPRETGEIGAALSWFDDRLRLRLEGQVVASPDDGKRYRADGSMVGIALGNYTVAVGAVDRWWGPGWDGSLILSNNARPIPAITIDRNGTDAFETKWLHWLGPWDLSLLFGRLESNRAIEDAQFFGMRFNFRPWPSLELGLSRTAQWCGEGRPCGLDTFTDLLLGRDNRGDSGIGPDNEPGNQLAGVDFRWNLSALELPLAVYGQLIGEDEAGGFPSRHIGQAGLEWSGTRKAWSYRLFGEYAETTCGFYKSDEIFDCAYAHSIYRTGYRYRGRSIGHGAESDSSLFSAGVLLLAADGNSWSAIVRAGQLNDGGSAEPANTLTATPQEIFELQLSHRRFFPYGEVEIGLGAERIDDDASGNSDTDVKAYLQWQGRY